MDESNELDILSEENGKFIVRLLVKAKFDEELRILAVCFKCDIHIFALNKFLVFLLAHIEICRAQSWN